MEDEIITLTSFNRYNVYLAVRSKLESEGIETFETDSNTAVIDPGLLAVGGGIRLQIRSSQAEEAYAILREFDLKTKQQEADNEMVIRNRKYIRTFSECPKCESENVYCEKMSFLKSLFAGLAKREHICKDCQHIWYQVMEN